MDYAQIGLVGRFEAAEQHNCGQPIKEVVQILLKDRVRFIDIVDRLLLSRITSGEDSKRLKMLEAALKGSPGREIKTTLMGVGSESPRLLALLVAYAVYEVEEN